MAPVRKEEPDGRASGPREGLRPDPDFGGEFAALRAAAVEFSTIPFVYFALITLTIAWLLIRIKL